MVGGRLDSKHARSQPNTGRHHSHRAEEELEQHGTVQQRRLNGEIRQLPPAPEEDNSPDDVYGVIDSIGELSKLHRQRSEIGKRPVAQRSNLVGHSASGLGDLSAVAHIEPAGESPHGEASPESTQPLIEFRSREKEPKEKTHSPDRRRKHKHWSDYLSRENERLRAHASKLEELLEQAGAGQKTLEQELELACSQRSDLEKLTHDGLVCGTVAATVGENAYLRKQLSAYAVEIDVLRKENESLGKQLDAARVKEQQLIDANQKHLESKKEISTAVAETNKNAKEQVDTHKATVVAKDQKLKEVTALLESYRDAWAILHQEFVSQTKAYNWFVQKMKHQQQHTEAILQDHARMYNDYHHALHGQFGHLAHGHRRSLDALRSAELAMLTEHEAALLERSAQAFQRAFEEAKKYRPKRASQILLADSLKEMEAKAKKGLVLQKQSQRRGSLHLRLASIEPAPRKRDEMLLKWKLCTNASLSSRVTHPGRGVRSINLKEVLRIEYGNFNPCVPKGVTRWNWFTVHTAQRPYVFICKNDDETRCLVLVLSRHCENAVGAIRSRQAFEAIKGWCKIADSCYKKRIPITRRLLEVLKDRARSLAKERAEHQAEAEEDGPASPQHATSAEGQ